MNHKCVYCESTNSPHGCGCATNSCDIPENIVCATPECNFRFKLDTYKIQLEEAHGEIAKLKAINNEYRILCMGPTAMEKLVQSGELDTSVIRLFVSKTRATHDMLSPETHLVFMELLQKMSESHANWLHEKHSKVQIKKDLIKKTEDKLKQAQLIREGKLESNGEAIKAKIEALNPFEKQVQNAMKFTKSNDQKAAEEFVKNMGFPVMNCRDLTK